MINSMLSIRAAFFLLIEGRGKMTVRALYEFDQEADLIMNVIAMETAAPNIMEINRCARQMALTTLFCGYPNCLKTDFLAMIAITVVAMIKTMMVNLA